MSPNFRCTITDCGTLCVSLRSLVHHVRSNHSLSKNIKLSCPVLHGSSKFGSTESFRKHIEWKHKVQLNADKSIVTAGNIVGVASSHLEDESGAPYHADSGKANLNSLTADQAYNDLMSRLESETVKFRLLLEHHFDLPNSTSSRIYDETMFFACTLQRQFSYVLILRLSELKLKDPGLDFILESPEVERVCKSTGGDIAKMAESVGYVAPEEIDLFTLSGIDLPPPETAKRPKMHYVSILSTLKSYLSHEDVLRTVLREDLNTVSSIFTDFTSGSLYKEHPLFSREPHALRIILYTDELELCNPLGGCNLKHKMCVVYFQVANIGTKHLSSLQSIHLAIMVKWHHVQTFSYSVVLKPLPTDLHKLAHEGVQVAVRGGGSEWFRGAVAFACGDNLSMHAIGGFQGCFNSGKVCRFCFTDYRDLSSKSHGGKCVMRSPEMHARHVSMVKQDQALSSVYGVTAVSVASELPFCKVPSRMEKVD